MFCLIVMIVLIRFIFPYRPQNYITPYFTPIDPPVLSKENRGILCPNSQNVGQHAAFWVSPAVGLDFRNLLHKLKLRI